MTKTYAADAARFAAAFESAGAIRTESDGFQWIDQSKVPASLVRSYGRFIQYGAANGLI